MPIPVTMNVEARQLKPGDTIQWVGEISAPTAWAGLTVKRVQEPRLKAHRGTHIEVVPTDDARRNPLLAIDEQVGITRPHQTYGERRAAAEQLLRWTVVRQVTSAQAWSMDTALRDLTHSNKGIPHTAPWELLHAARWNLEGTLVDAQHAHWWQRIATIAERKADDGGTYDDHLIDATQIVVAEASREVQSLPSAGADGAQLVEVAKWKGSARFLEELINFGYRAGGPLTGYQRAVELEAQYGPDMPALLS